MNSLNKKPTVILIIKKWLKKRIDEGSRDVYSYEIETILPEYGKIFWDQIHNPSTYSRAWRAFKISNEIKDIDLKAIKADNTKGTETKWILITGT